MATLLPTVMGHAHPNISQYVPSTAGFTAMVAQLLKRKHKYLVMGDIIKNEQTLIVYCNDFLIHFIYLHLCHWGYWSLPQAFPIFNDTFKTILETKLQVFLGGSILEHISLQFITQIKFPLSKTYICSLLSNKYPPQLII